MLPRESPKWRTVHSYFAKWSEPDQDGVSVLERTLKKQVGAARIKQGRNAMTSFLIVDAQSVKNTDSAEQKGYDAGKKVSGIKRHVAVDTQGLPHAIAVTTANVTDRAGALAALDRCAANLRRVESVLVDGGYTGEPFAQGVEERLGATAQVVKRWFGLITQQAIRRGSFKSVKDLIAKINRFTQNYNQHCRPFAWTATADSIFQKLANYVRVFLGENTSR
jgi:transposase